MKRVALIILTLVGSLSTLYLLSSHVRGIDPVCPLDGANGCAIAATSMYAKVGPFPVALLGFLTWVVLLFLAVQVYRQKHAVLPVLIVSGIGVAAAGYYNSIMLFKLVSLCTWCEVSHFSMVATFLLAGSMAWERWLLKSALIAGVLFSIPFVIAVATLPSQETFELAKCLTEKNVTMYGAYWCPHCEEQKELFGDAFEEVNYVECALPNNPRAQTKECQDANITSYPTWIRSDGKRITGAKPLDLLKKWSDC